jgi:hypothetical protein
LAQELRGVIAADPESDGWTNAVLEVRYSADGSRRLTKARAKTKGLLVSVSTIMSNIDELTKQIWAARGDKAFYGFAMTIRASGEVDVQLNHDPACFDDPRFFVE